MSCYYCLNANVTNNATQESISIQSINCFVYYFVLLLLFFCVFCVSVSIRTSLYAFVICVYLFLLLFLVLLSHWMSLNLIHINIIIKWGINLLLFSANTVLVLSRLDSSLGDERQSIESMISKFIDDFWIFECFVCLSFLVPFMIVMYWV